MNTRDMSKEQTSCSSNTIEAINCGSLQRIADACESMSKNYLSLQADLEWYKSQYETVIARNKKLKREKIALKGVVTRLKNELASVLPAVSSPRQ